MSLIGDLGHAVDGVSPLFGQAFQKNPLLMHMGWREHASGGGSQRRVLDIKKFLEAGRFIREPASFSLNDNMEWWTTKNGCFSV